MAFFVVINEQGPGWEQKQVMREQKGWTDHGGPLKYSKHRAMLVVNASNEQALRRKLAEDPWMITGVLKTIEIYPWEILLGKLS
jgi:hypothetical protein